MNQRDKAYLYVGIVRVTAFATVALTVYFTHTWWGLIVLLFVPTITGEIDKTNDKKEENE